MIAPSIKLQNLEDIESLIFNAIRREHLNKIILPAIKNGSVVLCDRFIDSTIVYQGIVGKVSEKDLLELHKTASDYNDPQLCDFLEGNFLNEQVKSIYELSEFCLISTNILCLSQHLYILGLILFMFTLELHS